jgi:membrane protein required for colicin V production
VNYVDIGVLAVIGLSALLAMGRGLVKEVLSMFGWVGAAIATYLIWVRVPQIRDFARQQIAEPVFADIAAGVVIFTVTLIILGMINHLIVSRIPTSFLGPLDKSLGLVFGLLRGVIVVALAHILLVYVFPNRSDWPPVIQEARTEPYAAQAADYLTALVPEEIKAKTDQIIDQGIDQGTDAGETINDNLQSISPGTSPENSGGNSLESGQNSSWTQPATQSGTQGSDAGNAGGQDAGSGYKDAERRDLQRLLQGQQQ